MNHRARLVAYLLVPAVLAGLLVAFPQAWAISEQSQAAQTVPTATPRPPPLNDNFADATMISSLPFTDWVSNSSATTEAGEPQPCYYPYGTVWYSFTPSQNMWLHMDTSGGLGSAFLVVYRADGPGFDGLSYMYCNGWGQPIEFQAQGGTTYYLQAGSIDESERGTLQINVREFSPPPPYVDFSYWPYDPSTFDTVGFSSYCSDPAGAGIDKQSWDLGDGTTAEGCCPSHRYTADADYTVTLTCTTPDGRSGTSTKTIAVRTHDVAIVKLAAPQAAAAGQTRQVNVEVKNKRIAEDVRVELYRSVPGGFEPVGSSMLFVPVRSGNRTTTFRFSYTFTAADAALGKVTFKAYAYIVNGHDALPADNEAISPPTKVSGK